MNKLIWHRLIRLLIVLGTLFFSFIIVFYITTFTYPFVLAILFASLLNPIINFLQIKWKLSRSLAVLASISFVLALVISIITILIIELIRGTTYLGEHIPAHFKTLVQFVEDFIAHQAMPIYEKMISLIRTLDPAQQATIKRNIENIGDEIASTGANTLQALLQNIPVALGSLPNYMTVFIFSLLGTFFIAKDWYKLHALTKRMLPESVTESGSDVVNGLKKAFFGFAKAQCILISITAVIVLIGLLFLQVKYAITIAVITGLIDLIPYLGTGIVFLPWIAYLFLTGQYGMTIGLTALYMVVIVQRQVMEPKILSTNIGLDPLATLVALFVGFQIWGFAGLILSPALLVVINTLYQTGVLWQIWLFIKGPKEG
ncbi:sporulation integral membrane protein YtvI [Aquibacillus sp. 3ASR75-11]|uniref:Sporulation integral membrane protein YtvI n=1 Tax=Terrihalobacillus insolitus TaxID=2950438 RepID=A0A9X4AL38_9BACI|nr:sporulation integral membrane protein YtvI [Terrihalobacillus insolitus]MDC3412632.1 sporulation integral membrane protein YtvI [Terrihalobacillus insolitus]MDC3423982.1 sporulation integral membrane protein YtvI [Terrihalobacillus insolitus]